MESVRRENQLKDERISGKRESACKGNWPQGRRAD